MFSDIHDIQMPKTYDEIVKLYRLKLSIHVIKIKIKMKGRHLANPEFAESIAESNERIWKEVCNFIR